MKGPDNRPELSRRLGLWLAPIDRLFNSLYSSAYNPLYQSGVLASLCLGVALLSGLYLLLFYRVGDPYGSTLAIQAQWYAGRWVRGLHRYASDLSILFVVLHAGKMLVSGRTSGPRTLAWVTGVLLTLVVGISGVTGLVLVWDTQAQRLVSEALAYLDLLPFFSEPLSRLLAGDVEPGTSFFFVVMFLHVAIPLGGAGLLWLHVSRVARPRLWPARPLRRFLLLSLLALSVLIPVPLGGRADLLALPGAIPLDVFYSFWLPWAQWWGRVPALLVGLGLTALALAVPWLIRTRTRAGPSFVDERHCVGCTICALDCPYDAIRMVPRTFEAGEKRSELVALVDPDRCVSCGICAGSCAPMGVGPPNRTGRDQLALAAEFVRSRSLGPGQVVVLGCDYGPGQYAGLTEVANCHLMTTGCSGSVHTSVLEYLLRHGAEGVVVLGCPERDCTNREGPKWLELRVHQGREAELRERVDRRRVLLLHRSLGEGPLAVEEIREFQARLGGLPAAPRVPEPAPELECEAARA